MNLGQSRDKVALGSPQVRRPIRSKRGGTGKENSEKGQVFSPREKAPRTGPTVPSSPGFGQRNGGFPFFGLEGICGLPRLCKKTAGKGQEFSRFLEVERFSQ
jgi:hypothetical protein